ncbi:MAG: biopolymer transport protein ExbD [Thermotogota bacterium]|nr:biopolymer transport protein ExbD [Thermotogota bacterium]MDK2864681.1 biopolymer transport protein ExbD [Thermotogota bacterium]HCZ06252.1 hypothetical protein [Thermotogota bacterium]
MRSVSKIQRGRFERISLELTPLVDIVFLLLIFLVVTTTFVAEERVIDVKLPQAFTGTVNSQQENKKIDVVVDRDGNIFVDGQLTGVQDLAGVVQIKALTSDIKTSRILADESAPYGLVIKVMDILRATGITDVELSVESGGK